jgi:hypothetical protein
MLYVQLGKNVQIEMKKDKAVVRSLERLLQRNN